MTVRSGSIERFEGNKCSRDKHRRACTGYADSMA